MKPLAAGGGRSPIRSSVIVIVSLVIVMGAVSGCAASRAYREGNTLIAEGKVKEGLDQLKEAVRRDPTNAEYRIGLANRRLSIVQRLLLLGETAFREGRLSDAEKIYVETLNLDPDQAIARQGIAALIAERRHRAIVLAAEAILTGGGDAALDQASEKIRGVLAENPAQKEALHLQARIAERREALEHPETRLAEAFRKPITLEFSDAPIRSVFDLISKVSGLNFFLDKDVRPDLKATIVAKNSTVEDAVRLVLITNQLEQKVLNDNSVLIYPNTPQKQKDYQTLLVRSFYLANADAKSVSETLKTIAKTKDIVVDERLGLLIIRDTPDAVRLAEKLVALQDLGDPEVMLEVEVLEVQRNRLLQLGVQWPSQLTLSPLQLINGAPLTLNQLLNTDTKSTQAFVGNLTINARKEDTDGNVLANPRIRVRNREKAKILIGDRVPVITTTSTSTGFVSESVNYVDVGLKLDVETNVHLDDDVAINVNLEVSSIVREVLSRSGTLAYQIGTRGASTILRLKDGETQILAGLISEEERATANKVPALGELPLAGRLFGSRQDSRLRSEILLSITPHILRSIRRPSFQNAEFDAGTDTSIGAPALRLSPALEKASAEPVPAKSASAAPALGTAPDSGAGGLVVTPSPPDGTRAAVAVEARPEQPSPKAANPAKLRLSWQGPAEVHAGERFSVVLRLDSQAALHGLPLLIGYDPKAMQLGSVEEGEFFKQGNARTTFNYRVDAAQGKAFATIVRPNPSGADAGVNGIGGVVTFNFVAAEPTGTAKIELLSANPDAVDEGGLSLPPAHAVKVLPK